MFKFKSTQSLDLSVDIKEASNYLRISKREIINRGIKLDIESLCRYKFKEYIKKKNNASINN